MKNIQRSLLVSLAPLFIRLNAFAETDEQAELITPISGTKVRTDSWRASQVMGADVKNSRDETIGDVEDLLLDMKDGETLAVVISISSGAFLGIADTLIAVPVSALRYDEAAKAFRTRLTKEQLAKAPHFKSDAWPDYRDANSMEAMRSYRDWIGGDVDAPDNTAQSDKEREKDAANPTLQGSSAKDLRITKDIRSGIIELAPILRPPGAEIK